MHVFGIYACCLLFSLFDAMISWISMRFCFCWWCFVAYAVVLFSFHFILFCFVSISVSLYFYLIHDVVGEKKQTAETVSTPDLFTDRNMNNDCLHRNSMHSIEIKVILPLSTDCRIPTDNSFLVFVYFALYALLGFHMIYPKKPRVDIKFSKWKTTSVNYGVLYFWRICSSFSKKKNK